MAEIKPETKERWKSEPATENQIKLLKRMGGDTWTGMNKLQAHEQISQIKVGEEQKTNVSSPTKFSHSSTPTPSTKNHEIARMNALTQSNSYHAQFTRHDEVDEETIIETAKRFAKYIQEGK